MMGYNMWNFGQNYSNGWGWGMMIFGSLFYLLLIVALVLLIIWLIKQIQK